MLISNPVGARITPPAPVAPASSTLSGSGATPNGGTSQAAAPEPTSITPPSVPPQRSAPVQPTTAAATAGSATGRTPPNRADAVQVYARRLAPSGLRPAPAAGIIEAEVRRLEAVETAEITKPELIKQASVALLAQANLRQQDVLDILNV